MDRPGPALFGGELSGGDRGRGHAGGPEQVDFDGGVERRIETDGGGRMDDDVTLRKELTPVVVETEAVRGHVAGHRRDPAGHFGLEPVAVLLTQAVEAIVAEDLTGHPLGRCRPASGAHQEHHPGVGDGPQQSLDQGCSQESGGSGDEELPALEGMANSRHPICLPYGK